MSVEVEQKNLAAQWMAAARAGDLVRAWQISDRALALRDGATCWHLPRHEQWVWDGRPLAGRVLVRCYHGLGDTIQYARFLPQLSADVVVWAQPELLGLLETLPGTRELLPLHDGAPETEYDVEIELMELGHALRVTLDALPGPVPYFRVPPAARHTSAFSVGLLARAGDFMASRSVPPDLLVSCLSDLPVALFGLQLGGLAGTTDLSTPDILELAASLQALDLVISADTMVAHLAGALGVPTWTLLATPADWRWMDHRRDSPWYPSMRLFRQPRAGDWSAVVQEVRSAVLERSSSVPQEVRSALAERSSQAISPRADGLFDA